MHVHVHVHVHVCHCTLWLCDSHLGLEGGFFSGELFTSFFISSPTTTVSLSGSSVSFSLSPFRLSSSSKKVTPFSSPSPSVSWVLSPFLEMAMKYRSNMTRRWFRRLRDRVEWAACLERSCCSVTNVWRASRKCSSVGSW